jgi:hypothetical protein
MAGIHLKAREAAYLRAFAKVALEVSVIRDTIDDQAAEVIGGALSEIGRQLARDRFEEGFLVEDLFPLIFIPRAYLPVDPERLVRDTFTTLQ